MALILYNTATRNTKIFRPLRKNMVRMYTCGPTVYRSQHIGNYRTFIAEDILKRVLKLNKYTVHHIMNITDVGHLESDADDGEDKIAREARLQKKTAWDIARAYEVEFKADLASLNILAPKKFVRATDHIKDQINLIQILEKKGYTYRTRDGLYFDTSRFPEYGTLALRTIHATRAGARVAMGEKHSPTDFALWKFAKEHTEREMQWQSPWGVGFPGWHIECSAMSMKYLGSTLDIHCGGMDHMQIHHPNEIAQSEAATGKLFSRFWMHVAFLTVRGTKMAKSSPDTNITLATLKEKGFDPLDFRYFTLQGHYRKPLSFHWAALEGAKNARHNMIAGYQKLSPKMQKSDTVLKKLFIKAINTDINTAQALATVWRAIHHGASQQFVAWADTVLGLGIKKSAKLPALHLPPTIQKLIKQRELLRKAKKWHEADKIRDTILAKGYALHDSPSESRGHSL